MGSFGGRTKSGVPHQAHDRVTPRADADRKFCGAGVSTGTVDTGFRLPYCALVRLEPLGHPQVGDRQLELADVELRGAQLAKPSGVQ